MASTITFRQLIEYHSIDRQIYVRLVSGLSLDSNLAKKIVTFWYWLELNGQRNFIMNMLPLPNTLFSGFVTEAQTCLYCLNSEGSLQDFVNFDKNIPLMRYLVTQDFSLVKVYAGREKAVRMMERLLKNVFERIFSDIVPIDMAGNGVYIQTVMANGFHFPAVMANGVQVPNLMANGVQVQNLWTDRVQIQPAQIKRPVVANGVQVQNLLTDGVQTQPAQIKRPVVANGVQVQNLLTDGVQTQPAQIKRPVVANGVQVVHVLSNGVQDTVTNGVQVQPLVTNRVHVQDTVTNGAQVPYVVNVAQVPPVVNGVQIHNKGCNSKMGNVQEDNGNQELPNVTHNLPSVFNHDRTLFITFSKGHQAISKAELRDLITRKYGNCVESIHMRHEPPPLFARVVLNSASSLAKILGENDLVKLCSNGKDVWARRFIPKHDEQPPLVASAEG